MTTPDGETREASAVLMLKQTGGDVTGSAGPGEDRQHTISTGKIVGDKLTLETDDGVKLELVLTGERLAGDITMSRGGDSMKGKIDVGRAK